MNAPRFSLTAFDELLLGTTSRYLVKNLVPETGLVLVWGPPKCGKSFWTLDLTLHIALEWQYRSHRVHGGHVVYCALEGAEGVKARAAAFRRHHSLDHADAVPFSLVAASIDLVADHGALITSIRHYLPHDVAPAVVILDTLNRSLCGSESSDEDMADYCRAADTIKEAFGCAVIVVHHCGHDDRRPRGHSSLLGAVDAQIAITRDAGNNIVATVERMKDGPEGAVVASRLEAVELGVDEDGDQMTSMVVVPVENYTAAPTTKRCKPSPKQQLALDCLSDLCIDGMPLPANWQMPAGIKAVSVDAWRTEIERRGVIDTTSKNPSARWQELKIALQARKAIGERDGMVWKV